MIAQNVQQEAFALGMVMKSQLAHVKKVTFAQKVKKRPIRSKQFVQQVIFVLWAPNYLSDVEMEPIKIMLVTHFAKLVPLGLCVTVETHL